MDVTDGRNGWTYWMPQIEIPPPPAKPPAPVIGRRASDGEPGAQVRRRMRLIEIVMLGLLVLALMYTLYFARALLIPIALATVAALVLSPVVAGLRRIRIPEPLGAIFVVIALAAGLGYTATALFEPATEWLHKLSESRALVEKKLESLRRSVQEMQKTTEQVERLTAVGGPKKGEQIQIASTPPLGERVFLSARDMAIMAAATIVLLYFLLASGDLFLRKLVRVLPRLSDRKQAVEIATTLRIEISRYLLTITYINIGVGVLTAIALHFAGLPNPLMWGVMATALNYIPLLGSLTTLLIIAVVSILTFSTATEALIPPALFWGIHLIESQLATPLVLGRRLTLNPVVIIVSLLFWGWLWGVAGALIAVPLLIMAKIISDRISVLKPIAEFLDSR